MSKVRPFRKIKFRLFCRREKWVLTTQGRLLILTFLLVLALGIFANIHEFLAVNAPLQADALVVEGWVDDEGVKTAVSEFNARNYKFLITTGGPLPKGYYISQYKTFAEVSAATLRQIGFNPNQLIAVPAERVVRDRTYAAALALKKWLTQTKSPIRSMNVYTTGVHARRSWLLYQKALGKDIQVGIISVPHLDYDAQKWWKSSAGVKLVVTEAISYWYTQLFNAID